MIWARYDSHLKWHILCDLKTSSRQYLSNILPSLCIAILGNKTSTEGSLRGHSASKLQYKTGQVKLNKETQP